MTKIITLKNKGYKWSVKNNIYFKGYLFNLTTKCVLKENDAINYFVNILTFDDFLIKLKNVDGVFSVICDNKNVIWAAVDISRSMPIYFSVNSEYISDSSELIRAELNIPKENIDKTRALEMLNSALIAQNNTIYSQIKQLDLGQAVEIFKNVINIRTYYYHINQIKCQTRDQAKIQINELSKEVFHDIAKVIDNRPVVLSLSGGYDSRYVACMLKSIGINDVSCYTYGNSTSFEVKQSKEVAKALGFRWAYVEYTDEKIKSILSDENAPYFDYCNEHDFTIYLQNFIAVKELNEKDWFKPDSVFLTGLCNDMPTGAYVKAKDEVNACILNNSSAAELIVNQRMIRYKIDNEIKQMIINEVIEKIDLLKIKINDYQTFVSVTDSIITGYDHSRRFLPMNKVHEYFGYQWLLPCWNKQLLDFWYAIPYEYRVNQNLYEEYLTTQLCAQFGLSAKKIKLMHSQYSIISNIKRILGGALVRIMYPLGLPLKRNTDQNNFAPLEILLYKKIKQKKYINFERAALTLLLTLYVMEKRYGEFFKNNIDTTKKGIS